MQEIIDNPTFNDSLESQSPNEKAFPRFPNFIDTMTACASMN